MTLQTLFDRMMLADNQLDLIAAGDDVSRGILAINMAQDWFEMEAALVEKVCQTTSTFTTTAGQEYTTWPAALLRIDDLWVEDGGGNPIRKLEPIEETGGHISALPWPYSSLVISGSQGQPAEFYPQQQGGRIYWAPKPDGVYTIRGYGLWAVNDYTAAGNTFGYPDSVALAIVPWATRALRVGLDRDLSFVESEAKLAFKKTIRLLGDQVKTGPESRVYLEYHDT